MYGRYGIDSLGKCILGVGIAAAVISWFTTARIFPVLSWACLIYTYFRMFSRNISRRSMENQKYLKQEMKIRSFFIGKKKAWAQRKEFHIYKCPKCGQKLRVPRGKGRIAVHCRKCGNEFIKKS